MEFEYNYEKPQGRYNISPDSFQAMLDNSAVCRGCNSPSKIMERSGTRQGLAARWIFKCISFSCNSHNYRSSLPISEKAGKIYDVKRVVVLAFRAIGKGRIAAQKFFSIMSLHPPVHLWHQHTRLIENKTKDLAERNFRDAVFELKMFKGNVGLVPNYSDEELQEKVVDVAASFDCSWSSRGWSARNGVVAVISEDTGKVLDAVYITHSCRKCTDIEDKRSKDVLHSIL